MNSNKILQRLVKDSEKWNDEFSVKDENITDLEMEDFYNINGEKIIFEDNGKKKKARIIFHNNSFYKKSGEEWFRCKLDREGNKNKEFTKQNEKLAELIRWTNTFKKYVDMNFIIVNESIIKLRQEQEEFFKEIKNYIDLGINNLEVKNGKSKKHN